MKIELSKYRLPVGFGYVLTDKLEKKVALQNNEYSSVCRKLADSIEMFTLHPDKASVDAVAIKFLLKYPNAVFRKVEPEDTKVIQKFNCKIKSFANIFTYLEISCMETSS